MFPNVILARHFPNEQFKIPKLKMVSNGILYNYVHLATMIRFQGRL